MGLGTSIRMRHCVAFDGVSNNAGGERSALLARDSIGIECHARE